MLQNRVTTEECGATTIIYYVLMKVDKTQALSKELLASSATYAGFQSDEELYVMTYMIAGDMEGFWYDSTDRRNWMSLISPPLSEDTIRLNAFITPGGIGMNTIF